MPVKKKPRRSNVRQRVDAGVQPATRRRSRIEDLLIEVRSEHDRHLNRIAVLQRRLDAQRNR
jgi:hypothetical protein